MTRSEAFVAIETTLRELDPDSTPEHRAQVGAEACLLALAHAAGAQEASKAAYEFADVLATGGAHG